MTILCYSDKMGPFQELGRGDTRFLQNSSEISLMIQRPETDVMCVPSTVSTWKYPFILPLLQLMAVGTETHTSPCEHGFAGAGPQTLPTSKIRVLFIASFAAQGSQKVSVLCRPWALNLDPFAPARNEKELVAKQQEHRADIFFLIHKF